MPDTPPVISLKWSQALALRMDRHHLTHRAKPSDIVRVASDLGGLHAQLSSSAELSLWARIDGLERSHIEDALWKRRALVKLWAIRGTLYVLPAEELGMWLSALGTYTKFGNAGHDTIDTLADVVGRVLRGKCLTREDLAQAVADATGDESIGELVRFSWGSYLKAASFRGRICFGPSQGNAVTFTHPETWVPAPFERLEPEEALRRVARRFLRAYAPAEAIDLARWWLGPPMPRRGAQLIAPLGDEAVEVDVEGTRSWMLAADISSIRSARASRIARLLPAFDPWVIGMGRHAPLLDSQFVQRVFRKQGWISPVVLVNGQVAGTWRHERKGGRLIVEVEPFTPLPVWSRRQIEEEAQRLATFYESHLDSFLIPS
jgi:uncharacterized protein YcaQ